MTIEMRPLTESEKAKCKACDASPNRQYFNCRFSCTVPVDPDLTSADYWREWAEENAKSS